MTKQEQNNDIDITEEERLKAKKEVLRQMKN